MSHSSAALRRGNSPLIYFAFAVSKPSGNFAFSLPNLTPLAFADHYSFCLLDFYYDIKAESSNTQNIKS